MTVEWVSDMLAVTIHFSTRRILFYAGYDDFILFIAKTSSQAKPFHYCYNIPNN